jgi:hypothetical protein
MKIPIDASQASAPVASKRRPTRSHSRVLLILLSAGTLSISTQALTGCGNRGGKAETAKPGTADTAIFMESGNEMVPIQYDEVSFPGDDLPGVALRGGVFHEDEVTDDLRKGPWFGLFQGPNGWYVGPTDLRLTRVPDPLEDPNRDESEAPEFGPGWEVKTSVEDPNVLLLRGKKYLKKGPVVAVESPKFADLQVLPGDTVEITYGGRTYTLYATGGFRRQEDVAYPDVWNYKLYVTSTLDGEKRTSLLVAHPRFDDAFVAIHFAGDLDGDGLLDWILDTSDHYNANVMTWYLSAPAPADGLVVPVAAHTAVGC